MPPRALPARLRVASIACALAWAGHEAAVTCLDCFQMVTRPTAGTAVHSRGASGTAAGEHTANCIVSGSADKRVLVWSLGDDVNAATVRSGATAGRPLLEMTGHTETVLCLRCFSVGATLFLLSGDKNGVLRVNHLGRDSRGQWLVENGGAEAVTKRYEPLFPSRTPLSERSRWRRVVAHLRALCGARRRRQSLDDELLQPFPNHAPALTRDDLGERVEVRSGKLRVGGVPRAVDWAVSSIGRAPRDVVGTVVAVPHQVGAPVRLRLRSRGMLRELCGLARRQPAFANPALHAPALTRQDLNCHVSCHAGFLYVDRARRYVAWMDDQMPLDRAGRPLEGILQCVDGGVGGSVQLRSGGSGACTFALPRQLGDLGLCWPAMAEIPRNGRFTVGSFVVVMVPSTPLATFWLARVKDVLFTSSASAAVVQSGVQPTSTAGAKKLHGLRLEHWPLAKNGLPAHAAMVHVGEDESARALVRCKLPPAVANFPEAFAQDEIFASTPPKGDEGRMASLPTGPPAAPPPAGPPPPARPRSWWENAFSAAGRCELCYWLPGPCTTHAPPVEPAHLEQAVLAEGRRTRLLFTNGCDEEHVLSVDELLFVHRISPPIMLDSTVTSGVGNAYTLSDAAQAHAHMLAKIFSLSGDGDPAASATRCDDIVHARGLNPAQAARVPLRTARARAARIACLAIPTRHASGAPDQPTDVIAGGICATAYCACVPHARATDRIDAWPACWRRASNCVRLLIAHRHET